MIPSTKIRDSVALAELWRYHMPWPLTDITAVPAVHGCCANLPLSCTEKRHGEWTKLCRLWLTFCTVCLLNLSGHGASLCFLNLQSTAPQMEWNFRTYTGSGLGTTFFGYFLENCHVSNVCHIAIAALNIAHAFQWSLFELWNMQQTNRFALLGGAENSLVS